MHAVSLISNLIRGHVEPLGVKASLQLKQTLFDFTPAEPKTKLPTYVVKVWGLQIEGADGVMLLMSVT